MVRSRSSWKTTTLVLALAVELTACGPERGRGATAALAASCRAGERASLGACVPQAIADAICGPGSVARDEGDACVMRPPCGPGRARELATGECLSRRDVRALAAEMGIVVEGDDEVACEGGSGEEGGVLVAATSDRETPRRLGCLPMKPPGRASPAPGSPSPAFGGGDGHGGDGRGRRDERGRQERIDVVRWLRAAIGPDGSTGSDSFCSAMARQPGALASPTAEVRAEIVLVFPDNDVSQVAVRSRVTAALAGVTPVEADRELERVVAPRIEALRALGGTASEGTVSVRVRCKRASSRPRARPQNCARGGADQC